jgi:hypothetical protein
MDVVTGFLNYDVEEFTKGAPALRLVKGVYCLKKALRLWNDAVNATLHRLNLTAVILTLVYT